MLEHYKLGMEPAGIHILQLYMEFCGLGAETPNRHKGFYLVTFLYLKKQPVLQTEDCTTEARHFPFLMLAKGRTRK